MNNSYMLFALKMFSLSNCKSFSLCLSSFSYAKSFLILITRAVLVYFLDSTQNLEASCFVNSNKRLTIWTVMIIVFQIIKTTWNPSNGPTTEKGNGKLFLKLIIFLPYTT